MNSTNGTGGEHVSLYYAKAFDGDWYLLRALASARCQDNLRTTGMAFLEEHPLPRDGFDDNWQYAFFVGKFFPDENSNYEGHYEGVWSQWRFQ